MPCLSSCIYITAGVFFFLPVINSAWRKHLLLVSARKHYCMLSCIKYSSWNECDKTHTSTTFFFLPSKKKCTRDEQCWYNFRSQGKASLNKAAQEIFHCGFLSRCPRLNPRAIVHKQPDILFKKHKSDLLSCINMQSVQRFTLRHAALKGIQH